MKFLCKCKDGGPLSRVWAYILFESKIFGSVILLKFEDGSREAFHSHAFNAISWVLKGKLTEYRYSRTLPKTFTRSLIPIYTSRHNFHMVVSEGRTWAITFRGPWTKYWHEIVDKKFITLTHGRVEV
jgi:hypothetical protein